MKFTMHRNFTLRSTCGLSMEFKKGEAVFVPPPLYQEAIAAGAVPEETLPEDALPAAPAAPIDPLVREKRLAEAFDAILKRNTRGDFTAGGRPHAAVLSKEVGWPLDAKERDEAWIKYTASKG